MHPHHLIELANTHQAELRAEVARERLARTRSVAPVERRAHRLAIAAREALAGLASHLARPPRDAGLAD